MTHKASFLICKMGITMCYRVVLKTKSSTYMLHRGSQELPVFFLFLLPDLILTYFLSLAPTILITQFNYPNYLNSSTLFKFCLFTYNLSGNWCCPIILGKNPSCPSTSVKLPLTLPLSQNTDPLSAPSRPPMSHSVLLTSLAFPH